MPLMNNSDIQKYLPHRYPFLLVDKVIEITPGQSITAIKNVTVNEPFFTGHFPGKPIMPGVLILEALAQASGLLIYQTVGYSSEEEREYYFLAGIDEARFKRPVEPGDQLTLQLELVKHRLNLWKFKGVASVDGEVACSAILMNVKES